MATPKTQKLRFAVIVEVDDPEAWLSEYDEGDLRECVRGSVRVAVENAGTGRAYLTVREVK